MQQINMKSIFAKTLSLFLAFRNIAIFMESGKNKIYPKVIQLPITYKCNSRCVMCNIWKMDYSNEASVQEFADNMRDRLFKEVVSVGINGGEPSLIRSLPEYADEILKLPSIKSLNIISHGFNKKLLLSSLEAIYKKCRAKGVIFHVSISLDGFGVTHDEVRGISGVFNKTISTVNEIIQNKGRYCDSFDLGCTVVKQNVDQLIQLSVFVNQISVPIKYRLGIDNKRIESDRLREQYSVIYSPSIQSAAEFFHWQSSCAKSIAEKFKYFSIWYWLTTKHQKRLLGCMWKQEGVTLDSRGSLYYCAVASDEIGSLRKGKGEEIFFSEKNISYRQSIIRNNCDTCIHDYSGKIQLSNLIVFIRYALKRRFAMRLYKLRLRIGFV